MTFHRSGGTAARRAAVFLSAMLLACNALTAAAQWHPERVVEFSIPTAPGGNNDRITRLMQSILQERKLVTQPIVVVNRPGGGQHLAVVHLLQRPRDPHLVLFKNPTIFTNELTGISPTRYTELTPLALLLVENTSLAVRTGSPLKSMRDLVSALRADPDGVSFAMPSRGGVPHLTLALAVKAAGLDPRRLKIVVFKGSGDSMTALLGGHIDVMVSSVGSVVPQVQAGGARILGIGAARRLTGSLSGVPTFREQGLDSTGVAAWRSFFGTRGITAAQVAFWDDAIGKAIDTPEWRQLLDDNNLTPHYLPSREFAKYLEVEYANTRTAMADLGLLK